MTKFLEGLGITRVLLIGFIVYMIFDKIMGNISSKVDELAKHGHPHILVPFHRIGNALILVTVFAAALTAAGLDVFTVILSWGFALFAFGLSAQWILSDIVAGMYITLAKPFSVDDIVQLPQHRLGTQGKVVTFFNT